MNDLDIALGNVDDLVSEIGGMMFPYNRLILRHIRHMRPDVFKAYLDEFWNVISPNDMKVVLSEEPRGFKWQSRRHRRKTKGGICRFLKRK